MKAHVIGLDIGGANIKAAHADGRASSRPFPIWEEPDRLTDILCETIDDLRPVELVAVTMTAELADCFETKAEGVRFVLDAVRKSVDSTPDVPVFAWQTGAEFVTPNVAQDIPLLVAAANWHALATFAGRLVPESTSLLMDIGSTTTDLIPLHNGVPVPCGMTDSERLLSGGLVYTGGRRTPLCALARSVPFRGGDCPLAAELFATTLDVYLLLDVIPEDPLDTATANGKPATKAAAHDRVARMLCCDRSELSREEAIRISRSLADAQKRQIMASMERVLSRTDQPCGTVLISGSGEFLAEEIARENANTRSSQFVRLADCFGPTVSEAACAFAVARLATERLVPFL